MLFRQGPHFTLKLRNMIIVLMVTLIFLMFTIFLMTMRISFSTLEYYFKSSSDIIFQQQTDKQLQYYLKMYEKRLKQEISSGNQSLQSIQLLYNEISSKQTLIHTQTYPEYSLQLSNINEQNEKQFGILAVYPIDPIKEAPILNLTSLLNEYLLQFGFVDMRQTQYVYYTDLDQEQLYFQYPADNEEGFIPQEFQQYKDYMQSNLTNEIIPPYLYWDDGPIIMSIYYSMFNLDKSLEGVLALDFTFLDFQILSDTYFMIVNQNGLLLTFDGSYTHSTLPLFNNSEITGFNQNDWDIIMNQSQTVVYNSLIDQPVYVQSKHWTDNSFILLTYQDVSPYTIQSEVVLNSLYSFRNQLWKNYYLYSCTAILSCLIFQFLMIYKILEPLTNFTLLLKCQIYLISQNDIKRSFIEQIRVQKLKAQLQIYSLYRVIAQANQQSRLQKSEQCTTYELFTFPKQQLSKRYRQISLPELQDEIILAQVEIMKLINMIC